MPTYDEMIEDRYDQVRAIRLEEVAEQVARESWIREQARFHDLNVRCVHCGEQIESIADALPVDESHLAHRPGRCALMGANMVRAIA